MRSLVLYYSKTGNTRIVADTIKKTLKAHTKEITDNTLHRTLIDYLFINLFDSANINPTKIDVEYYELIFIGTPVWIGNISPAIKKIISNTDFKNKNIVLFNTSRFVGGNLAMKNMAKYIKKSNGNIIGAFTILTNGNKKDISECTIEALESLNLT